MVTSFVKALGIAALGVAAISGSASATVLFSENFNGYTGNNPGFTSTQPGTNLTVEAGGYVPGWSNSTTNNALNALDRGNGNIAIMFYDGNLMQYGSALAVNNVGMNYTVSFVGSLATYNSASQVTVAGDYVQFLLSDSSGNTVASYQYFPDLTTTAFLPVSFNYTGTGSGSLFLVIKDGLDSDGRFGGAIDNVSISDSSVAQSTDVPEPASMLLLASGLVGAASLRRRSKAAA